MKTIAQIFLSCFVAVILSVQVFANDGGVPYIEVLGVDPKGHVEGASITVYGGSTYELARTLPQNRMSAYNREIRFVSNSWLFDISCAGEYIRPTNGERRSDWACEFTLYKNRSGEAGGSTVPNSYPNRDGYKHAQVLGVNPKNLGMGQLFSIYGNDAYLFAQMLPQGGITLSSNVYWVHVGCVQNYVRPTTGEYRSDFKCSVDMGKNGQPIPRG